MQPIDVDHKEASIILSWKLVICGHQSVIGTIYYFGHKTRCPLPRKRDGHIAQAKPKDSGNTVFFFQIRNELMNLQSAGCSVWRIFCANNIGDIYWASYCFFLESLNCHSTTFPFWKGKKGTYMTVDEEKSLQTPLYPHVHDCSCPVSK
jgi:hypothetical protein